MNHTSQVTWQDGMAFDVEVDGHRLTVDAEEEFGGKDQGPRPKPLLLSALGGCTAMDVVSMLKKMRVPFDSFSVVVDGVLAEEHPKVYRSIRLTYTFTGEALDRSKIERAVELSQTRYCGVTAMVQFTTDITHEIKLNP
jgi:putative redox protein